MADIFSTPKGGSFMEPGGTAPGKPMQLVAVYDADGGAHLARDALVAAGIAATAVHVIDRSDAAHEPSTQEKRRDRLMGIVGSLFARSEAPAQFHLAEDPTHALVVVVPGEGVDRARAAEVLRATGPVEVYDWP